MKKRKIFHLAGISLLATVALCGFFFVREYLTAKKEISEYASLQSGFTTTVPGTVAEPSGTGSPPADEAPRETDGLPYVNADFDALLRENPDTVGWVAIPDSTVSYPVVQAGSNEKYLDVSFIGKKSKTGAVFAIV